MSKPKIPQTPFRLTPDVRKRLEREAARLGLSLNGALNVTLDRCLSPLEGEAPAAEPGPIIVDDGGDGAAFKW
jgi:hypothetical protein